MDGGIPMKVLNCEPCSGTQVFLMTSMLLLKTHGRWAKAGHLAESTEWISCFGKQLSELVTECEGKDKDKLSFPQN